MKEQSIDLTNHFLIAMPSLNDAVFKQSVVYICEYNDDEGAVGLIINVPLNISLKEVFSQMELQSDYEEVNEHPVMFGGPVQQERGFVLHPPHGEWSSSLLMSEDLSITTSQDILRAIARKEGPPKYMVILGYAGWTPQQLEEEIKDNQWLVSPAHTGVIFDTPVSKCWEQSALLLGVDIHRVSGESGHA